MIRLQKKVLELEGKLEDAVETIQAPLKLGGAKDKTTWIPRWVAGSKAKPCQFRLFQKGIWRKGVVPFTLPFPFFYFSFVC